MEHNDSIIAILGIGTSVPAFRIDQADAAQRLAEILKDHPDSARWAKRIFKQCGVESRYTCEPNLLDSAEASRYLPCNGVETAPSTAERMKTYKRESVPLGLDAAKKALRDGKVTTSNVTHLLTVSCTGQFLPGLDTVLVKQLGLAAHVNRIPLNFTGCAAGLKAIGLARQIVSGQPFAKVLIVCVELCTLHIQPSGQRDALFAASFFGDGASACLVGSPDSDQQDIFQLGDVHSVLLPDSAEEMVWEIGDYGFDLYLSPNIPRLIGRLVPPEVEHLLHGDVSMSQPNILSGLPEAERLLQGDSKPKLWAIHPGGRGIVDALQDMFELSDEQTRPSRTVLRDYGNVSSATLLFVLNVMKQELKSAGSGPASGIALAFGPGLTAEMIKIAYLPSIIRQEQYSGAAHVQ